MASSATANADDLSPSEFVKKIRELGEKKDAEDAERLATLEKEIEQGRKEREMRRAERARSISPEKSYGRSRDSASRDSPPISPDVGDDVNKMQDDSPSPTSSTPQTASQLARSGTLSWQQRPKSRDGRRPLSWFAQENAARSPRGTPERSRSPTKETPEPVKTTPESASESSKELSRAQIAESLGSKDPTWFRQTPDRGIGSAAYRRSQEEEEDAVASVGAGVGRMRLPGMSRDSSAEAESKTSPPPDSLRSGSPSRTNSIRDSTFSNRFSNTTIATEVGSTMMKSPPASILEIPKLEPSPTERKAPMGARPPSPTKGMGGFVESAMLKRADSVSKRWSHATGTGVSRNNSSASNRSSYMGGYGGAVPVTDRTSPALSSRDNSLEPSSRPTSSHSNLTITQKSEEKAAVKDDDGFVKPSLPNRNHSRSKSVASLRSLSNEQTGEPGSPASPSKRWSPTKSSWLESALTKEEKPKAQAAPAQPSWMAEINRAKQQRANSPTKELASPILIESKAAPFGRNSLKATAKEVSNPPPIVDEKTPTAKPEKVVSPPAEVVKAKSPPPEPVKAKSPPPEPVKAKSPSPSIVAKPAILIKEKPEIAPKAASHSPGPSLGPIRTNSFDTVKPTPASPGKFDFRANLKSRAPPSTGDNKNEPEFKNALGNLKRTKTQNYVAPDTLKDNITRGKAGLNITGGVPVRKRVDELKESLVAQKAAIKARVEAGEAPVRPQKPAELPSTPEALAMRKTLGRSDSAKESISSSRSSREETPEALAAIRSLREKSKPAPPVLKPSSPPAKERSPPPVAEKKVVPETMLSRPSIAERIKPEPAAEKPTQKLVERVVQKPVQKPIEQLVEKPVEEPARTSFEKPADKLVEKRVETQVPKSAPQPFALPGMIKPGVSSKLADRFNPALANMLARGPPGSGSSTPSLSRTTTQEDKPTAGPELEHKTKGRARGPKRRAPTKAADEPKSMPAQASSPPVEEVKEEPKPIATPAAVKPAMSTSKPAVSTPVPAVSTPKPVVSTPKPATSSPKPTVSTPSKHSRIPSVQLVRQKDVLPSSPVASSEIFNASTVSDNNHRLSSPPAPKPKPVSASKTPQLSSQASKPTVADESPKPLVIPGRLPLREHPGNNVASRVVESPSPTSPTKIRPLPTPPTESKAESPKRESASKAAIGALFEQRFQQTPPSRSANNSPAPVTEDSMAPMSVRDSTTLFARQESPGPFSSGRRSPIKLPTKRDEEKAMRDAGLMPPPEAPAQSQKPNTSGLGISSVPTAPVVKVIEGAPRKSPLSPPLNVRLSPVSGNSGPKTPLESPKPVGPSESPIPHTSEATRLFGGFFDERPVAVKGDDIDTLSILDSSPLFDEKVTTTRKLLQEITNDGKLISVPSHQEHMLFDQSMYVCTHSFSTARGTRSTEVYLWAGSDVSPASLEDAQLFGRRVAKDNGGKLIVMQQGQETARFMQALGGIIITFKGAKSRNSIGVPPRFVLCGRRHLGHIVFDEVDFTLHSFCSGFLYLISANNRLYLWKGIGCHQEELSSARLITMDVSPSPDLTEIEEGKEPASFFSLFPLLPKYPKNSIPRSADHWRLRPRHDNYRSRLFRVDQQRAKSMSLQVSSFLSNVIKRRPSWSSFGNNSSPSTPTTSEPPPSSSHNTTFGEPSPTISEQPRTPLSATTPAGGSVTTRIVEVSPFGQGDLRADGVFVLDAFFEVYVIVGPLAQTQSFAFASALHFAQDYGILAASMEDRPFVPVSTVVLEGAPRDMKFCFRQWDNEKGVGGTEALMAGKPKRAASLRCVGLSAALASLRTET